MARIVCHLATNNFLLRIGAVHDLSHLPHLQDQLQIAIQFLLMLLGKAYIKDIDKPCVFIGPLEHIV